MPSCVCAPGFQAIDPSNRGKGCRPIINTTTCEKRNMRFVHLPDTNFVGLDMRSHPFVSLHLCKNMCLSDYNCKGFQYSQGTGGCHPTRWHKCATTCRRCLIQIPTEATRIIWIHVPRPPKQASQQDSSDTEFTSDRHMGRYMTSILLTSSVSN